VKDENKKWEGCNSRGWNLGAQGAKKIYFYENLHHIHYSTPEENNGCGEDFAKEGYSTNGKPM